MADLGAVELSPHDGYGFTQVAGIVRTPLYLHSEWDSLDVHGEPSTTHLEVGAAIDVDAPGARAALTPWLVPGALAGSGRGFGSGHEALHELLAKIARGEQVLVQPPPVRAAR